MEAATVVVDIVWQLIHLLLQQQLKEVFLMEAWHSISGGLGNSSAATHFSLAHQPSSLTDALELYRTHGPCHRAWWEL